MNALTKLILASTFPFGNNTVTGLHLVWKSSNKGFLGTIT